MPATVNQWPPSQTRSFGPTRSDPTRPGPRHAERARRLVAENRDRVGHGSGVEETALPHPAVERVRQRAALGLGGPVGPHAEACG
jgi:hypothetical protein